MPALGILHASIPIENILGKSERETRSIANIRQAGELLGIAREHIEDIISPQDIHVFRLHTNMLGEAITVWGCTAFHNKARGFYKGGIRISADVTIWETIELSRLMTLKTALTDLEMGGAKTGINFDVKALYAHFNKEGYDPEFERQIKRAIIKEYAHHYRGMLEKRRYVPAPDLGTGPDEMVAIYNETHEPSSVTGKPEGISGWLPGRTEATGYGVYAIIRHLLPELGKAPEEVDCRHPGVRQCRLAYRLFSAPGRHPRPRRGRSRRRRLPPERPGYPRPYGLRARARHGRRLQRQIHR